MPPPRVNTLVWQQEINNAVPGSTLVLPSGVCVVAKCDIAKGKACYGVTGGRIVSAVDIDNKTNLTFIGAADGTSVLKLDPNPPLSDFPTKPGNQPPSNTYMHPSGQMHTGNIGFLAPCL